MNSTPRSVMLALACLALLSACDNTRKNIEAAVRESLKDPDSAKFGDLYVNDITKKGCMTINARNVMGGYTGDQQAFVTEMDGKWFTLFITEASQALCRKAHADAPDKGDTPSNNASTNR